MSPISITAFIAIAALFLAAALVVAEWLIRRGRAGSDDDSARS